MSKKRVIKVDNKKKKDTFTRSLIVTGVLIVVALVAIIATSFAYFQTRIEGKKVNYIKGTTFDVTFDDGSEYINLNNAGPESDEEGLLNTPYTFTINNDSNVATNNKIYFTDVESTIPEKYIKIAYKTDDGQWSTPKTLEDLGDVIEENKIVAKNTSFTYSIVLWISSDMPNKDNNDNSYMGTSYKSKITVETRQATSDEIENNN